MAFLRLALDRRGHAGRVDADDEESGAHAFCLQRVQHLRRRRRRAVVEGENNFMIGQRQRLRIALQANRKALGANDDLARGAEFFRAAGRCSAGARGAGEKRGKARVKTNSNRSGHWRFTGLISGKGGLCTHYIGEAGSRMTLDSEETATKPDIFRDESGEPRPDFVASVESAVAEEDSAKAHELVGALHEADLGALLELLDHETRPRLIALMGADFDFAALTEVGETTREDILDELPVETWPKACATWRATTPLRFWRRWSPRTQAEVLEALPAHERLVLRRSLDFPDDSAGRLMQTTLIAVPPSGRRGKCSIFFAKPTPKRCRTIFSRFSSSIPAIACSARFFSTRWCARVPSKRLDEIMQADRRRVRATDESAEVARLFERYNLVSVPVVDEAERLVGVITIDDIVDVLQEAASEEIKALGGVNPDEELSDDFWETAKSRFLWLLVNLGTAFIASSVLRLFESQLQQMVALAVLAPIVASQGGNSATQTMTVAVRALATRELSRANAMRVILRELAAGAVNGAAFGVITGAVAANWFQNVGIAPVIALAMCTNLIAGALGGVLVPLALERWKIDPAVSSSAFVTTVTDVVGYGAFLSIATLWFHLLLSMIGTSGPALTPRYRLRYNLSQCAR